MRGGACAPVDGVFESSVRVVRDNASSRGGRVVVNELCTHLERADGQVVRIGRPDVRVPSVVVYECSGCAVGPYC